MTLIFLAFSPSIYHEDILSEVYILSTCAARCRSQYPRLFPRKSFLGEQREKKTNGSSPEEIQREKENEMDRKIRLSTHLPLRLDDDRITESLQSSHSSLDYPLLVQRLKIGSTEIAIRLLITKQVVDNHDDAVCDGHDRPLFANTSSKTMILGGQIVIFKEEIKCGYGLLFVEKPDK